MSFSLGPTSRVEDIVMFPYYSTHALRTDGVINVDNNAMSVVADDLLDDTSEAVHALGSDTSPDGQQQMRVLSEMGLPTNSSPLNDVETGDAISDRCVSHWLEGANRLSELT